MNANTEENMAMQNSLIDTLQSSSGMGVVNTLEPEMALWVAVLNQAVRDARGLVKKVKKDPGIWNHPLFRSEVLNLTSFFQSKSMEPGGFDFICDLMDMDPDKAAQRIHDKYLRHLTPVTDHPTRMASISVA